MAPGETENNPYAKFWSEQPRVLWSIVFSGCGQLVNVTPCFFYLTYHAFMSIGHSCEINLRQLVATLC